MPVQDKKQLKRTGSFYFIFAEDFEHLESDI